MAKIEYVSRANLCFEPGESAAFAVDATGELYKTPAHFAAEIKDMACLSYLRGLVKYRLTLSGNDAVGSIELNIKVGSSTIGQSVIDFDGKSVYGGAVNVDFSEVKGASPIVIQVFGNTAAAAAVTASIAAVLDVEHPLVIGVA